MAKEVVAAPRLLKVALAERFAAERRAGAERTVVKERTGQRIHRLPVDWGTLAREGIHDRRARPDE